MARTCARGRGKGRGRGRGRGNQSGQRQGLDGAGDTREETRTTSVVPPLLTKQKTHKLEALKEGQEIPDMVVRHSNKLMNWNARYEPYIKQSGFNGVVQIESVRFIDPLIRAIVERWRPETHTFHLPMGEMTITLEDVSILLGLPTDGTPVCAATEKEWEKEVEKYLGVYPEGKAMSNKSALSLSWLRRTFSALPEDADENKVQQYVRAYILCMLGSVLLVDLTGDSISCIYLPLLENLDQVKSYAWGAAVLAKLYRQLCHGCSQKGKQIGGGLILLQMWIWERFSVFRRLEFSRIVLHNLTPEFFPPRGFYWSARHKWVENENSMDKVNDYRELIDALCDQDVEWTPYSDPLIQGCLPPSCLLGKKYWMSTVALIDFSVVETYHPDRVMRQFGKYQRVPPPNRSTMPHLHDIDRQKFSKTDWLAQHQSYIEFWYHREKFVLAEERLYDESTYAAYMEWYKGASIPTFSSYLGVSSSDGAPAYEGLCRSKTTNNCRKLIMETIGIAKKAAIRMKNDIDLEFSNETFKYCRYVMKYFNEEAHFNQALEEMQNEPLVEEPTIDEDMPLSQMFSQVTQDRRTVQAARKELPKRRKKHVTFQ